MPRKNFNELRKTMTSARQKRNQHAAQEILTTIVFSQLRKAAGLTQTQLAHRLHVSQANISKLERQNDMQISTLNRLVHAIGGKLEYVVSLPSKKSRPAKFIFNVHPSK